MDRRERWVSLWLTRVVAFLFVFENTGIERALHARIARFVAALSDCVLDLIAMRATWSAAYQQRMAQKRRAGCGITITGMKRAMASPRALIGGAMRRALNAKTLRGRAEALLRVLKNRDLWVAYIARRIARGQTRIYSAHARVSRTLPLHQPSLTLGWSPSPSKLGEEWAVAQAPP